jgi:UDP-glucose 4-epimerase
MRPIEGRFGGRAIITGGAGFIGSHVLDRLASAGWYVKVIDNFSTGRIENLKSHSSSSKIDVKKKDLKEVTEADVEGFETVFHYAANPEVRVSTINPEIHFKENIVTTFRLLEALRKSDVKEIIFASSSSVYGEPDKIPVDEGAPLRPVSIYGASKVACENLIHAYSKLYGIKAVILRYANIVGPRLRHGVIWDFVSKLKKNPRELEILGDGKQVRSYVYIDDAVEATMIAWMKSTNYFEVYNVASEHWMTVDEVADQVIKAMGLGDVKRVYRPVLHGVGWPGDVKKVVLRIDKLKALGFKPRYNSIEAVRLTVRALLNECQKAVKRNKA